MSQEIEHYPQLNQRQLDQIEPGVYFTYVDGNGLCTLGLKVSNEHMIPIGLRGGSLESVRSQAPCQE